MTAVRHYFDWKAKSALPVSPESDARQRVRLLIHRVLLHDNRSEAQELRTLLCRMFERKDS